MAVHELSHALWETLEGEPLDRSMNRLSPAALEKHRLLVEGYAVYAERVWFSDFYPACVRDNLLFVNHDRKSVHFRGFQKIEELVGLFGPHILQRIPKEWRDYC